MMYGTAVVDFGCVSFRILSIKFKFLQIKVCMVVGFNPNEGDDEERLGSGMTCTGFWIALGMDIDCAFWEI